jgi:hypothetical protein
MKMSVKWKCEDGCVSEEVHRGQNTTSLIPSLSGQAAGFRCVIITPVASRRFGLAPALTRSRIDWSFKKIKTACKQVEEFT